MKENTASIRTIQILHLVAASQHGLTITEISQALKIPKSTTYQILHTLAGIKVLEVNRDKTFHPGIRFYEIALPTLDHMDLRREGQSILESLGAQSGETVFMATHDAGEVVYLDQVEGPSMLRLSVSRGSRGPMHCTALGKAILAALDEAEVRRIIGNGKLPAETEFTITDYDRLMADLKAARERGFAVDQRELQPDISCVAAPVYDASGAPVAALSIASHTSKMTPERINVLGEYVWEAALNLSRRLGFQGPRLFF